jgi:hypothetical protein
VLAQTADYTVGTHLDLATNPSFCWQTGAEIDVGYDAKGAWLSTGATALDTTHYFLVRHQRDVGTLYCTFASGQLPYGSVSFTNADPADTVVTPSIEIDHAQVRIDSITIYAFGG